MYLAANLGYELAYGPPSLELLFRGLWRKKRYDCSGGGWNRMQLQSQLTLGVPKGRQPREQARCRRAARDSPTFPYKYERLGNLSWEIVYGKCMGNLRRGLHFGICVELPVGTRGEGRGSSVCDIV